MLNRQNVAQRMLSCATKKLFLNSFFHKLGEKRVIWWQIASAENGWTELYHIVLWFSRGFMKLRIIRRRRISGQKIAFPCSRCAPKKIDILLVTSWNLSCLQTDSP